MEDKVKKKRGRKPKAKVVDIQPLDSTLLNYYTDYKTLDNPTDLMFGNSIESIELSIPVVEALFPQEVSELKQLYNNLFNSISSSSYISLFNNTKLKFR